MIVWIRFNCFGKQQPNRGVYWVSGNQAKKGKKTKKFRPAMIEGMNRNNIDEALEINQPDVETWVNYGDLFRFLCRFDRAIDCYDIALRIDPQNAEARYGKAAILRGVSRFNKIINENKFNRKLVKS
jgi:tetratricopeptide (TPR) repeat protein